MVICKRLREEKPLAPSAYIGYLSYIAIYIEHVDQILHNFSMFLENQKFSQTFCKIHRLPAIIWDVPQFRQNSANNDYLFQSDVVFIFFVFCFSIFAFEKMMRKRANIELGVMQKSANLV